MLTEQQYQNLVRYRDTFFNAAQKPDDATVYFYKLKYIEVERTEYTVQHECEISYLKTAWVLTLEGERALEEFEQHAKEMAEDRTIKKRDRKFDLLNTLLGAVLGALFAILAGFIMSRLGF